MDYFPFVTLFHYLIVLLSSILAIKFSSSIIFHRITLVKATRCSHLLIFYFVYIFICNVFSTINSLYLIIWWDPSIVKYNAQIMYILGFPPWMMISCCSLIETGLGIDRCLALIFPLRYNKSWKKWILLGAVTYLSIGATGLIIVSQIFKIFPSNPVTACRFFGCMFVVSSDKGTVTTNPVFSIPSILVGIILAILIHKKFRHKQGHLKSINKTAYMIIALTTCFELIPALLNEFVRIVTGTPPNLYLGPYGNTLMMCNFTICIYIYSKAFKKFKTTVMIQHTNVSSNKVFPKVLSQTPTTIINKIAQSSRFISSKVRRETYG